MVLTHRFETADAQALADLMMEMVGFYGATVASDLAVAKDVIRQAQKVNIVVAHDGTRMLGFATFTSLYPVAGLLAFTYVQQIYVGQDGAPSRCGSGVDGRGRASRESRRQHPDRVVDRDREHRRAGALR